MSVNRWNSIGRTRRKLAAILTVAVQAREDHERALALKEHRLGPDPDLYPARILTVLPENIHAMRLVGRARAWEDAHSWEAYGTSENGNPIASVYSYDSMTEIVRAGGIEWIGKDGECVSCAIPVDNVRAKG